MVSTDPIADMLTRIRNAINVQKYEVNLPHSKLKEGVARLLKDANFIDGVELVEDGPRKVLKLLINSPEANTRITEIVRLSRPGRRQYTKVDDIPRVKRGRGVVIVSTSQGLMTGDTARSKRLGGELICRVY